MEFTESQKGKQKVLHSGYIYVFQKDLANDIRSFECELRRKEQYNARLKLALNNNIVEENIHIHPPKTKLSQNKFKTSCGKDFGTRKQEYRG